MLAASGTGFWEWDIPTGELTWSEAIFRQHGLEPQPGAPDFPTYIQTIHPDDRAGLPERVGASPRTGGPFDLEFRLRLARRHRSTGPTARAASSATTTGRPDPDGRHRPGHHRTPAARGASATSLLADERRAGEFREAFVDVISHELRTPITTILGLTQILARPGRVDDRGHAGRR